MSQLAEPSVLVTSGVHRNARTSRVLWAGALALASLWLLAIRQLHLDWSLNPQYSYGWSVVLLTLYLCFLRWPDRPTPNPTGGRATLWGAATLLLTLLPIRVFQEANPEWRPVSWMLAGTVTAITILAILWIGGTAWARHFAFPICFFLVAVPWIGPLERMIVDGLMRWNILLNAEILHWFGIAAVCRGNLIELPTGTLGVTEACSGVRSVQATLMVSLFLGELYRFAWLRRVGLVLAGFGLAFLTNLARTFALTMIASSQGVPATERWHDSAGYSVLAVCLILLYALARVLKKGSLVVPPASRRIRPLHRISWQFSFALLFWLAVVETGTELWYRGHEGGITPRPAWTARWPQDNPTLSPVKIDDLTRIELRYSEGQAVKWNTADGRHWRAFHFRWEPGRIAAQLAKTHNPSVCLPAVGLNLEEDYGPQMVRLHGLPLPVHRYRFDDRGRRVDVFYCLTEDVLRDEAQSRVREDKSPSSRILAALEGKRHLGQQLLEVAVWSRAGESLSTEAALSVLIEPRPAPN